MSHEDVPPKNKQDQPQQVSPLAAHFPKDEIAPSSFKDAMIFIPSKGRSHLRNSTWAALLKGETDEEKIPFTVVVEPQDKLAYEMALGTKLIDSKIANIAVLPLNDQGVAYARNYILKE